MNLTIPDPSLVVLVGPAGSGKSTFAARRFQPPEVVSSDMCRAMVGDGENDMSATDAAFRVLHAIAGERLHAGRLAVIDATCVDPESRKPLLALAHAHVVPAVAVVFDLPESVCVERSRGRADRRVAPRVIRRQREQLQQSLGGLEAEGFRAVYVLDSVQAMDSATIVREPLRVDGAGTMGR